MFVQSPYRAGWVGARQVNGAASGSWKRHPTVFKICGFGGVLQEPNLHYGACYRSEFHVVADDPPAIRRAPAGLFARNDHGRLLAKGKPPLCFADDLAACRRRARSARTSVALRAAAAIITPAATDGTLVPRGPIRRSLCGAGRVLTTPMIETRLLIRTSVWSPNEMMRADLKA